jgi:hypothetical protein
MYTGENGPMRERESWNQNLAFETIFCKSIQKANRIFINIDRFNKAGKNIKHFAHVQKVLIYIYRP